MLFRRCAVRVAARMSRDPNGTGARMTTVSTDYLADAIQDLSERGSAGADRQEFERSTTPQRNGRLSRGAAGDVGQ